MASSSAIFRTNNRPDPGSFDNVVPRQPPVCYENRMVPIGKPVEEMPDLLRALHCFSRNRFSDRRHGSSLSLSLSLADQLHAAHIPVSERVHILLSHNDLVAIRESNWILASLNIHKERGDLMGRSTQEAWKLQNGET